MEIFVFLRTGKDRREDIIVKLLDESDDLPHRLSLFDAAKARCFLDDDRERLLAVIETGYRRRDSNPGR